MSSGRKARGFSLLEVVMVVAILGILAAIGVPRMSRGSKGAANAVLAGDLRVLRGAIEQYALDHGGGLPNEKDVVEQLTQYTDYAGNPQATQDTTHIYGPYLRSIPPLPVGDRKGATGIDSNSSASVGWIYDETTGEIGANCGPGEQDDAGVLYQDY